MVSWLQTKKHGEFLMLTEHQLIAELAQIAEASEKVGQRTRNIYLGAGWFNEEQQNILMQGYQALKANPTINDIYVPLLNQYGGQVIEADGDFEPDFEWGTMTYKADITAMNNADLIVAFIGAADPDSGTAFEIGYMTASNKPAILVTVGDRNVHPVNLMLSYGAVSNVDLETEGFEALEKFDFTNIAMKKWVGSIL